MREKSFLLPQPLASIPFIAIYGIIAVLELLSYLIPESFSLFHFLAKPLIMLSLAGYFLLANRGPKSKVDRMVLAAMGFSFLGDVFLMFSGKEYFLLGLGSFLFAQIAYVWVFRLDRKNANALSAASGKQHRWFGILFILYGGLMLGSLWPKLGDMQIPVLVYSLVITLMGLAALDRYGAVSSRSFWMVLIGALLFIISDSLIAFSRFGQEIVEISLPGFWIMLTYILAQFLIIMGWMDKDVLQNESLNRI